MLELLHVQAHLEAGHTRADISPELKNPEMLLRRLRVTFLSWWLFTLYVRSCMTHNLA